MAAQARTAEEHPLEAGLASHARGDLAGAEMMFRRAASADPGEPTALYLLGLVRFEAGDADEAVDLMEEVVVLRPDHAQARLTLANLRHWRGEHAAAAGEYARVVELDPNRLDALTGLSQARLAAGEVEGALAAARSALTLSGRDQAALLAFAAALASLGRAAEAALAYRAVTVLAPANAAAHTGLSLALFQSGEPEPALDAAEQAVALDETSAEAWFALGALYRALGQPAEGSAALARSITLDPDRAAAHLTLGAASVDLEDYPLAETCLLRALALDPAGAEAHANLSSLYCRAEQWDHAREHAEAALILDPALIVAHQNLAGIFAREGREEEARRHRDHAYGVTNLFVVAAARPLQRVLVLTTTESGNTPDRYLMPADRYTRLNWFVEYATPGQMAALPPYDVVFNGIGDPDLTGPTARNVAQFLDVCERPFFNQPARIERTRRHLAAELFAGIDGVVVPKAIRVEPSVLAETGLAAAVAEASLEGPLLVRPIGSHGGQGLTLVRPEDGPDALQGVATPGRAHYVTAFHDFRSADGLYRKYRMIYVDRALFPYHLAIGDDWMVHYEKSGTADDTARIAEERRFLEDPEGALGAPAMEALRAIGRRMDLDFCGVDFNVSPDGRVLVFEANATMLVHPEAPDGPLAYKNAHIERILTAFRAMLAGGGSAV